MSQAQEVRIKDNDREAIMFVMLCTLYVILKQEHKNPEVKQEPGTESQETRKENVKYVKLCIKCMHYHECINMQTSNFWPTSLLEWRSYKSGNLLNA